MKTKSTNTTNRLFAGRCSSIVGSAIRPLTTVFCLLAALCLLATAPQAKAAEPTITHMAAGGYHSLFIKSDGTLWAMGNNLLGQLGDGTTTNPNRNTPVQVKIAGVPVTNAIAVAAGELHSLFVKSDGTLWAMGNNSCGQLGNGTATGNDTTPTPVPVQVKVAGVAVTNVKAVAASAYGSLFIRNDNTLWAMGKGWARPGYDPSPVPVSGGTDVKAVATGEDYNLFVKNDGTLWTGLNGDPFEQVPGVTGVTAMAVSGWDNRLFVKSDRTLWRMGFYDSTPEQMHGVVDVSAVAAGGIWNPYDNSHEHILFIKSDNTLWAVGDNNFGQLGDASTTGRNTPVQVFGGTDVKAVTAGIAHTLFIKNDGTLWAMGLNHDGQLGDGSFADQTTPVPVRVIVPVPGAPVITTHPVSQTVNVGANVTFTVVATGSNLSYQWMKNSANLSGAASASYTINNVQKSHEGSFSVRVSNPSGTVTSNAATLTVNTTGTGGNGGGSSGGGGGGGAPSLLWLCALAMLLTLRRARR